jgi:hypothetical protein
VSGKELGRMARLESDGSACSRDCPDDGEEAAAPVRIEASGPMAALGNGGVNNQ